MTLLLTQGLTYQYGQLEEALHTSHQPFKPVCYLCRAYSSRIGDLLQNLPGLVSALVGKYPQKIIELNVLISQTVTACAGYSTWSIK